jgi:hypothetical protein
MPTGVLGTAARQDPRQVSNTLKKTVNWNDAATGVPVPFANYLPQGAFILNVWIEVVVAFNGTTPTLTVGTNAASYNNIVAAGDATWTGTVIPAITQGRGLGRSLTAAGDVLPYAVWNATGSPSAGQAIFVIEFEGGWQS